MGRSQIRSLIIVVATVLSLCLPGAAAAGTFTWNMPGDFTASGRGSNPDHDRYGAHPWTYIEGARGGLIGFSHNPSAFQLLPQFVTGVRGGLVGWTDPADPNALIGTGAGAITSGADTFNSGELILAPPADRVVAVGWTSPLSHSATVSVSGAVGPAGATSCFTWSLDQNGRPLTNAATSPTGSVATSATVAPGGSLYLVIEPLMVGYNADCATAQATLTISEGETQAPRVTLDSPGTGALITAARPTFSGSASTGFGTSPSVTVKVYAGSAPTGSAVQTVTATRVPAGTYSVKASGDLRDGTYTAQAEQDDLSSPPDAGLSSPATFTVHTAAPRITLNSLGSRPLRTDTPTLSGVAGSATGDSSTVLVRVYAGRDTTSSPMRFMQATVGSGGHFSAAVSPALPDGTYTAAATQNGSAGGAVSNAVTFRILVHPVGSAVGTAVTLDRHNVVTLRVSCFKPVLVTSCSGDVLVVTAARLRPVSGGPTGHVRVLFAHVSITPGRTAVVRRTLPGYVARALRRPGQMKLQVSAHFSGSGGGTTIRTLTRTR